MCNLKYIYNTLGYRFTTLIAMTKTLSSSCMQSLQINLCWQAPFAVPVSQITVGIKIKFTYFNCNVTVVRYAMCKVNLAYLYSIISLLHTCTHAVLYSTSHGNPISSCANINLHVTRYEHWILPRGIVYTMQDLAMEACYTIHETITDTSNNSLGSKRVVATVTICHTFSYLVFCQYSNAK